MVMLQALEHPKILHHQRVLSWVQAAQPNGIVSAHNRAVLAHVANQVQTLSLEWETFYNRRVASQQQQWKRGIAVFMSGSACMSGLVVTIIAFNASTVFQTNPLSALGFAMILMLGGSFSLCGLVKGYLQMAEFRDYYAAVHDPEELYLLSAEQLYRSLLFRQLDETLTRYEVFAKQAFTQPSIDLPLPFGLEIQARIEPHLGAHAALAAPSVAPRTEVTLQEAASIDMPDPSPSASSLTPSSRELVLT